MQPASWSGNERGECGQGLKTAKWCGPDPGPIRGTTRFAVFTAIVTFVGLLVKWGGRRRTIGVIEPTRAKAGRGVGRDCEEPGLGVLRGHRPSCARTYPVRPRRAASLWRAMSDPAGMARQALERDRQAGSRSRDRSNGATWITFSSALDSQDTNGPARCIFSWCCFKSARCAGRVDSRSSTATGLREGVSHGMPSDGPLQDMSALGGYR
jgi:hypothetical protein